MCRIFINYSGLTLKITKERFSLCNVGRFVFPWCILWIKSGEKHCTLRGSLPKWIVDGELLFAFIWWNLMEQTSSTLKLCDLQLLVYWIFGCGNELRACRFTVQRFAGHFIRQIEIIACALIVNAQNVHLIAPT